MTKNIIVFFLSTLEAENQQLKTEIAEMSVLLFYCFYDYYYYCIIIITTTGRSPERYK